MAERYLVLVTGTSSTSVQSGRNRADGGLDLGKLVLVILGLRVRVVLQPLSLLLDRRKEGLLVLVRDLATHALRIIDLRFDGEDKVWRKQR